MDGRGRAFDNIFVERLWRSGKYENVYLKGYQEDLGTGGLKTVFSVLQQRTVSSISGVSDPARSLRGKDRMESGVHRSTLIHKKERKKGLEKQVIKTKKTVLTMGSTLLLKRARLLCCDFEKTIKDAKTSDLVYFDPPYITTHLNNGFIKYNSKLFHHTDELRLARVAHYLAMSKVFVLASNAAHPLIKQQYDGPFYKIELQRTSVMAADSNRRTKFAELLISSFPINPAITSTGEPSPLLKRLCNRNFPNAHPPLEGKGMNAR